MATHTHTPQGVCSRRITFALEGGTVTAVAFEGGCHGNTQGVARLVTGMRSDEVVRRLRGICCGGKGTSCPDQLARGLENAMQLGVR